MIRLLMRRQVTDAGPNRPSSSLAGSSGLEYVQGVEGSIFVPQLAQSRNGPVTRASIAAVNAFYAMRMSNVVVVGAGLAGLAAARRLVARGHEVTVVEARQRVGGRTEGLLLADGPPLELGRAWRRAGGT